MTESVDFVKLTTDPLDLQEIVDLVKDNGAGAISTFSGTTRNTFNGSTDSLSTFFSDIFACS